MPGATTMDGGIATFSVSSDRIARCAGVWKAAFLTRESVRISHERFISAYFMVEATPPRRMRFSCSVKTRSFDNGYSRSPSVFRGSRGRGVRKNILPTGICVDTSLEKN